MEIKKTFISNVLDTIKLNNIENLDKVNILHLYFDDPLEIYELKNTYPSLEITNLKLRNNYIENLDLNSNDKFDYIIIYDVLEKLINYELFFKNIKSKLKENGYIILSVLNIMHKDTLEEIFQGRFYNENNIITSKSNLRFYTLNEVINLFNNTQYEIVNSLGIIDKNTDSDEFMTKLNGIVDTNLMVNYSSYAYLITAKNKAIRNLYDYIYN